LEETYPVLWTITLDMIDNYPYETLCLALLAVFIFNYFSGSALNRKIADAWVSHNKDVFLKYFSVVGDSTHSLGWD